MKLVECEIKGVSALLMHRFSDNRDQSDSTQIVELKDREQSAEAAAYRMPGNGVPGNLYIPAENIRRALVSAAGYEKGKGRGSLAKFAAAAIFVFPEYVDLGVKEFEIDSRPVVIPATRGRVIRHRPRLSSWRVSFTIEFNDELISGKQLRSIVDHCGSKVGLLDYRPEKKGPYGRFMVTAWID